MRKIYDKDYLLNEKGEVSEKSKEAYEELLWHNEEKRNVRKVIISITFTFLVFIMLCVFALIGIISTIFP